MPPDSELFIGLMSGTSMDAIDAVLVDFAIEPLRIRATHTQPLPEALRGALLRLAAERSPHPLQCLGELDHLLGSAFADTAQNLLDAARLEAIKVRAIGSHGQTLYHSPGGDTPFTLQIGDPNRIAQHTGITTVADFRRRDMAAGGQGAPLVPAFHSALFRRTDRARAVVNIGGMANVTLLPTDRKQPVTGFDTGPGNVLMDCWIRQHRNEAYDKEGAWGASGKIRPQLLARFLSDPYFQAPAPKSTGREHFNLEWVTRQVGAESPEDVQATLCELTASSVADAIRGHLPDVDEIGICGGGAYNALLLERLRARLPGCSIVTTDHWGLEPQWVEGAAFAWLARQTLRGLPGNLPEVTGAGEPVPLGAIYPGRSLAR
ncbi:anhydro-N-acetylmuramic acid kinase [Thiohalomonas denitrificans]|uniref:Anhydro-N-acetylmuramic acid kinase n=1 Tax=Thiohalomonas denitrificans TaxID=415747 RepID=A0A1G5PR68_9GAMM|nr:anhydro-N-acetylmuramic acid kinase [Thiohalomonas denitrificans]SCZ51539.1 anhydro-N-acetylmuramic acid kinase [Thiohalomonas denitrificans]